MLHNESKKKSLKNRSNKSLIRLDKASVLSVLEEIEAFSSASDSFQIHFEFFKNYNSENTRKAYYADLKHFFSFFKVAFKKQIRHPKQVQRFHIVAYKEFLIKVGGLEGLPAAPKSIGRRLGTLNSYFKFLMEKLIIESNPVEGVKRPRQEVKSQTNYLSDDQVKVLLNSIVPISLKDHLYRCILHILFGTGIRVSELVNLKVEDYMKKSTFKILSFKAKGGKMRMIPLRHEVSRVIDEYLIALKKEGHTITKSSFLIRPTRNNATKELNKPLSRATVFKIIQNCCRNIGIFEKVSPHSARATLITSLLAKGVDLYKVSLSVGHENPKTTKHYDKMRRNLDDSALFEVDYF